MLRRRADGSDTGQSIPQATPQAVPQATPPAAAMAASQQSGGASIPDRRALEVEAAAEEAAKRLLVGKGIKLNGELQRCDTLVVEGHVDALLKEGRVIEIAECGSFKGTVSVDQADIGGRLEGDLTVRQRLTIRATGRVEGTVRYGELAIEAGGVLVGPIELLPAGAAKAAGAGGSTTASDQAPRPTTQTPRRRRPCLSDAATWPGRAGVRPGLRKAAVLLRCSGGACCRWRS